ILKVRLTLGHATRCSVRAATRSQKWFVLGTLQPLPISPSPHLPISPHFPLLNNPIYCTQVQTVIIDSVSFSKSLSHIHLAIDQAAFHRTILSAEC
ncbi:hypothetical protein, partial [Moorena producens]